MPGLLRLLQSLLVARKTCLRTLKFLKYEFEYFIRKRALRIWEARTGEDL